MPNLALLETVDSVKLANTLNKELLKLEREKPLPILVQVHTGDEDTKFGVPPAELSAVLSHIQGDCPQLKFSGLMSMGRLHDLEGFKAMAALKKELLE